MSLAFTFLCTTSHEKELTLDGTSNIHIKLAEKKGPKLDNLDKAKKKDFIKNKPEEKSDQALVSRIEGDKCTKVSEDRCSFWGYKLNSYNIYILWCAIWISRNVKI